MAGYIFGCHSEEWNVTGILVGRDQGCCYTSYSTLYNPLSPPPTSTSNGPILNIESSKVGNTALDLCSQCQNILNGSLVGKIYDSQYQVRSPNLHLGNEIISPQSEGHVETQSPFSSFHSINLFSFHWLWKLASISHYAVASWNIRSFKFLSFSVHMREELGHWGVSEKGQEEDSGFHQLCLQCRRHKSSIYITDNGNSKEMQAQWVAWGADPG